MSVRAIPEAGGRERRMLALAFGLLAFLATLAFALGGAGQRLLVEELSRTAAVAIVSLPAPMDEADEGDRTGVLAVLRADPEVDRVDPIPEEEVREILVGAEGSDLPLPVLMEVRFATGVVPDFARIGTLVRAVAADSVVEDAGRVGRPAGMPDAGLLRVAGLGAGTVLLMLAVLAAAMLAAGRVRRHRDVVDLLRALGASDRFLVEEFHPHPLRPIIVGGLLGTGAAVVLVIAVLGGDLMSDWAGMGGWPVRPLDLAVLLVTGLLIAGALAGTARLATGRALRRLR
jgi:cell division transport system permease protein